jgi:hypothetical protein
MTSLAQALPQRLHRLAKSVLALSEAYGHRRSVVRARSIDAEGNPIPWYTYPCIEYLDSLDFTRQEVLEYGAGASSLWWARRASSVLSVEHDPSWLGELRRNAPSNLCFELADSETGYVTAGRGRRFGVIVIDGRYRQACAETLGDRLKEDGLVLLDNSDWYPRTARYLREALDLIQVDFHGFGPINGYTWTTSILVTREFKPIPRSGRLPCYSLAALRKLEPGQE